MRLFDIFKKKPEPPNLFAYREEDRKYTASLGGIEFTAQIPVTPEMTKYAQQLAAVYQTSLPGIAEYMLNEEAFDYNRGIFPDLSQDTLIASLNKPTIQLLSDHDGVCTYYNHTLDDIHIITFEFSSLFDDLCYFSIDG